MTATRAAFLRAICENPDDDTARLVFADWLDEQGDADRAAFIRLQVGLAAGTVPEAEREAAEARVAALLDRHQAAWWGELPHRRGVTWYTTPFRFERGFAHGVGFGHGKAWREHAEEIFAAAPVSRLGCGGTFTPKTARPVFSSPLLGRVAEFRGAQFDVAGAEAFATNPHLVGRLRRLETFGVEEPDAVATVLARAPGLRNLEALSLGSVGPAGAVALAGCPYLTRLKDLSLHGSTAGDDGAEALAASPYLSALEHVLLNYSGIGDRGAVALARSERLVSLRQLYLGGDNPITDAAARKIAASKGLPALAELHLWGSRITAAGARVLADFAERRGLTVLNLRDCRLSARVVKELTARLGTRFHFGW